MAKRRKIYTIINLAAFICIVLIILPFLLLDMFEVDIAVDWTMRYFAIPLLLICLPSSIYIYLRAIIHDETKKYSSKLLTNARTCFRIAMLTAGFTFILMGTILSSIILTNTYFGSHHYIHLNATIIDSYKSLGKYRTHYYIKIQDKKLNRTIELEVDRIYPIGESFIKKMEIGYWGLLYSKKQIPSSSSVLA